MYTIYEIPGVKIGCTKDYERRSRDQKDKGNAIILETHTCIYEASNREQELQVEYGYPKDDKPYHMVIAMQAKVDHSAAGRKGTMTQKRIEGQKRGGYARPEVKNPAKHITCPHCGKTGHPGSIATHIKYKH